MALPLSDEEIFQKIPVVRPAADRPGKEAETADRPVGKPEGRPGTAVQTATAARPGTAAQVATAAGRPDKAAQVESTAQPATAASRPLAASTAATAPSFSPRLVRVETEVRSAVHQPTVTTTIRAPTAVAAKTTVVELVEVYDYYAANQIQFRDEDDVRHVVAEAAIVDFDDDQENELVR